MSSHITLLSSVVLGLLGFSQITLAQDEEFAGDPFATEQDQYTVPVNEAPVAGEEDELRAAAFADPFSDAGQQYFSTQGPQKVQPPSGTTPPASGASWD